jgi:hypothetical protein
MWKRIEYWIQHRPKTMLFFIFLLTVFIRLPQLTRPLSKHHELNTAAVLVCLKAWSDKGLTTYHGAPVQYYNGPYNVFNGPEFTALRLNESGAYMSLGPGSYLMPWFCMSLLHIQLSIFFIRSFILLLHFVSTLLIFQLLLFFQRKFFQQEKWFPFTGSLLFLTAPAILWFMGNSYSHESMVIPFYLLALLYGFKITSEKEAGVTANYAWYALSVMAAIYTDWLGIFIAFVFFIKGLFTKVFRHKFLFLFITAVAALMPVAAILWQYISLVGWHDYTLLFVGKMGERGLPAVRFNNAVIKYLLYFAIGYGLVILPMLFGLFKRAKPIKNYLVVMAAIPFLHYLIFIGFSGEHDYAVLKWSPLITLLATIALQAIKVQKRKVVTLALVLSSFIIYELVNPPFATNYNGEKYSWMKEAGETIKRSAASDEYIFVNLPVYYHQIEWYAGRNFRGVISLEVAQKLMQYQKGSKGIFYRFNEQNQVTEILRLTKQ